VPQIHIFIWEIMLKRISNNVDIRGWAGLDRIYWPVLANMEIDFRIP
jgi:hypothetical protein